MLNNLIGWILIPFSVCRAYTSVLGASRSSRHSLSDHFYHTTRFAQMPRGVKKENLPSKDCIVCGRPYMWRKKWERCWDEVTTCSKSCNAKRRNTTGSTGRPKVEVPNGRVLNSSSPHSAENSDSSVLDGFKTNENVVLKLRSFNSAFDNISQSDQDFTLLAIGAELTDFDDISQSDRDFTLLVTGADLTDHTAEARFENDLPDSDYFINAKAERKAAKKLMKAERRDRRQGLGDPSIGQKVCDMCDRSVDLLIRCQYDESKQWKMVCGKCWEAASGGVVDGDANHPYYRYGGLWKNRGKG